MTAPPAPRLPVGQTTSEGFRAVARRVVRPDLPTSRKVWALAWPVVLTNLMQSFALTVDLIFVGALGSVALAATGVATQVFYVGMVVATGLAAGATALVARAIGAGDKEAADRATAATVVLALAFSLPLILVTYYWDAPLLRVLGADETVVEQGGLVLRILAFATPANMLMTAATGALTGAGDTRPALVIGIGVNVANLVLDWLLIFGNLGFPEMGLAGAAVATAASFSVGGLAFLFLLWRGRRPVALGRGALRLRETMRRLLRVGAPAGLEALVLSLGFTAYLVLILRFGADALAAHQIGLRVQGFAFMPGFGFSAAAAALVGQGLGRGEPREAEADGWASIGLGLLVMMALSLPLYAFARPLAGLFTQSEEALALGVTWIRAIVLAMPAIAFHFGAAGALRGAGDTRWPLLVSFGGLWLVRLPLAWLIGLHMGYGMVGVWAAYILEYYARAVVTTWRFARGSWKRAQV
ncbi:MAG TPA: MATE family efflux transporter [Candidatus Thermoplasmatota archaeon]|nr:MATE family efflux transporter [Candidatus Thermoplasmatota archaeon]